MPRSKEELLQKLNKLKNAASKVQTAAKNTTSTKSKRDDDDVDYGQRYAESMAGSNNPPRSTVSSRDNNDYGSRYADMMNSSGTPQRSAAAPANYRDKNTLMDRLARLQGIDVDVPSLARSQRQQITPNDNDVRSSLQTVRDNSVDEINTALERQETRDLRDARNRVQTLNILQDVDKTANALNPRKEGDQITRNDRYDALANTNQQIWEIESIPEDERTEDQTMWLKILYSTRDQLVNNPDLQYVEMYDEDDPLQNLPSNELRSRAIGEEWASIGREIEGKLPDIGGSQWQREQDTKWAAVAQEAADKGWQFSDEDYANWREEVLQFQADNAWTQPDIYTIDEREYYTPEEASVYAYLMSEGRYTEAAEYGNYMQSTAAGRRNEYIADATEDSSIFTRALTSVATNPYKVVNAIDVGIQGLERVLTGSDQPIDFETTGNYRVASNTALESATEDLAEYGSINDFVGNMIGEEVNIPGIGHWTWGNVLNLGISQINSLVNKAMFGPGLSGTAMGIQSGIDAAADVHDRGAGDLVSIFYGGVFGAAEGIGEQIEMDTLTRGWQKTQGRGGLKTALAFGLQLANGGTQEAATEMMQQAADNWFMGDLSNYDVRVAELMSLGYPEDAAKRQASEEAWGQVIDAFIMGALGETTTYAAGLPVASYMNNYNTGATIRDLGNADKTAEFMSMVTGEDVKAPKGNAALGRMYNQIITKGNKIADRTARSAMDKAVMANYDEAQVGIANTKVDVEYNERLRKALKKLGRGDKLTGRQEKLISGSDRAKATQEAIKSGDIEVDLTDVVMPRFAAQMAPMLKYYSMGNAKFTADDAKFTATIKTSGTTEAAKARAEERKESMSINVMAEDTTVGEEKVTVVGIGQVAGDSNAATVKVTDSSGNTREVGITEVTFNDVHTADVYSYAEDMATPELAQAFIASVDSTAEPVEYVANGMQHAYEMAYNGYTNIDAIRTSPMTTGITKQQLQTAYDLGVKDRAAQIAARAERARKRQQANANKRWQSGRIIMGDVVMDGLSEEQKRDLDIVDVIAKVFGINIELFESKADKDGNYQGERGSYDPKTNTMRLDVRAGVNKVGDSYAGTTMLKTVAHELTHSLQRNSPEKYVAYKNAVLDVLEKNGQDIEAMVDARMAEDSSLKSPEDAIDEIVADASETMLRDSDLMDRLQELHPEEAKTFIQKVLDLLKRIKDAIREAFEGVELSKEAQAIMSDIDRLAAQWSDLAVEAAEVSGREASSAYNDTVGIFDEPARPAEAHIDQRNWKDVGDRSVNAFLNDYKYARAYMGNAADVLLADLNASVPGERYQTPDGEWVGQKRQTSDTIAYMLDNGMTWDSVRSSLEKIFQTMETGGVENDIPNTAAIKRTELMLDEMLTIGYTALDGTKFAADAGYIEYKNALPGAMANAIPEAAEGSVEFDSVRFSTRRKQTDTPEFKKWFADSKVVNEDGSPKVVYHGTNGGDFYTFDWDHTQRADAGFYGRGHYFTTRKGEAEMYGDRVVEAYLKITKPFIFRDEMRTLDGKQTGTIRSENVINAGSMFAINAAEKFPSIFGNKVFDAYDNETGETVKIKWADMHKMLTDMVESNQMRLLRYGDDTYRWQYSAGGWMDYTAQDSYETKADAEREKWNVAADLLFGKRYNIRFPLDPAAYYLGGDMNAADAFTKELKKQGYDGVMQSEDGDEIVVFDSRQIKSATDNIGTFDPDNPDIRYSTRRADNISDREILANVLEDAVQNEDERELIEEYRSKLGDLAENQKQLDAARAIIRELAFKPRSEYAEGDLQRLETAREDAKRLANKLARADKRLLKMQAMTPVKNVLARARQQAEVKMRLRKDEQLRDYRSRREATQLRKTVIRKASNLDKLLRNPTDKRHLPEDLRKPVLDLMEAFTSMDDAFGGSQDALAKLSTCRRAYERMKLQVEKENGTSDYAASKYDDDIAIRMSMLEEVINANRKGGMHELTADDLRKMSAIMDHFEFLVREGNKEIINGKRVETGRVLSNIFDQMYDESTGRPKYGAGRSILQKMKLVGDTANGLHISNLTPVYFSRMMSGQLGELMDSIINADAAFGLNYHRAQDRLAEIRDEFDYDSWAHNNKELLTITAENGAKLKLTREQALCIWATDKRERGSDIPTNHLALGGVIFDEKAAKSNFNGEVTETTGSPLSRETLTQINDWLTDEQKRYADAMVAFVSNDMARLGNETSMELHGYKKFREGGYYFPFRTPSDFIRKEAGRSIDVAMYKNEGFTKPLQKGASTPVLITDFSDAIANHVERMCKYNALAVPQDTLQRILNYKAEKNVSVESLIRGYYGSGDVVDYMRRFLSDIHDKGRGKPEAFETLGGKLASMNRRGSVLGSASVAIQQPSALPRAMAMINLRHFRKPAGSLRAFEEAKKYSGVCVLKDMGGFDAGTSVSSTDWLLGRSDQWIRKHGTKKDAAAQLLNKAVSIAPEIADKLTWGELWNTVKREQAYETGLDINSEELKQIAGKRMDEVCKRTQVYDSVMVKSQVMRNEGRLKQYTSFMAEPTVTYNMVADALREGLSGHPKAMLGTIAAVVASIIYNNALKSIVLAGRDDDDEKAPWGERWFRNFMEGNINDVVILNYVPIARDVWSMLMGYDVERPDASVINKGLALIVAIADENKSVDDKLYSASQVLGTLTPVPIGNIWRDLRAVKNTFFKSATSDNEWRDNWTKYAMRDAVTSNTPLYRYLGPSDAERLYRAALEGDDAAVAEQRQYMIDYKGKDDKKLNGSLKSFIKKGYINGDMDDEQAIGMLTKYAGMAKGDAADSVLEWSYERETGVAYSDIKDSYLAGDITAEEASAARMKYGGVDEDTAASTAQQWRYQKDTGIAYTAMKDEYIAGNISRREAEAARVKYGGMTKEDAAAEVLKWDYEAKYGHPYSDMKDEYIAGNISRREAEAARVKYGGKSAADAAADVLKWDYEDKYGHPYSEMKDEYLAGNIKRDTAVAARVKYGGQKEEDAAADVSKWDYEAKYGHPYTEMKDEYLAGNIKSDTAVAARVRYGGAFESDAAAEVLKWDYEKETGIPYTEMKDEYLAGNITSKDAVAARIKYGGLEPDAAELDVRKWDYEAKYGHDYDDMDEYYNRGELTHDEAVAARVKYGGQDEAAAYFAVEGWEYTAATGKKWNGKNTKVHDAIDAGDSRAMRDAMQELYDHGGYATPDKARIAITGSITTTYKPLYIAASPAQRAAMEENLIDAYEMAYKLAGKQFSRSRQLKTIRKWLEDDD